MRPVIAVLLIVLLVSPVLADAAVGIPSRESALEAEGPADLPGEGAGINPLDETGLVSNDEPGMVSHDESEEMLGDHLPLWSILPFVGLLLCIAILPLTAEHWFEKNSNRAIIAAVFGVPMLIYLVSLGHEGTHHLLHVATEYVQFITLLASLFIIAGGVYITGNLVGRPLTNVVILLIGAVLANFIGTTGAAMVLIRPLLRANAERKNVRHIIIFFIFIVCNCGGLLTPLGDPPLFLGFLRGVDFFWTLRLIPEWILCISIIIVVFLFFELPAYRKEKMEAKRLEIEEYLPVGIAGRINILFLAGVIGAVLLSNPLKTVGEAIHFPFVREVVMAVFILLSLFATPTGPRKANHFTFGPILEVAILFAGIFATMVAPLAILEARGDELGLESPMGFFWITGCLSSFLDNAPTYLTFVATAQGYLGIHEVPHLMSDEVIPAIGLAPSIYLAAISCGAVFMGANSYIGNAPNFMVKSIAEENGIKMPSFFGYMLYSGIVLVPIFGLVTFIFFT